MRDRSIPLCLFFNGQLAPFESQKRMRFEMESFSTLEGWLSMNAPRYAMDLDSSIYVYLY